MITAGCLGMGYYFMQQHAGETLVRTVIFVTLLFSNIFLTLVNRSFKYSVFTTLRYKNHLVTLIISVTILFMLALLYMPTVRNLFLLERIPFNYLVSCMIVALACTIWIEPFKQKQSAFHIRG